MKLGHTNDEIKFDGVVKGTHTLYLVTLDGQPTMHIVCDIADETGTIHIRRFGDPASTQATNGRFAVTHKMTEDVDGVPLGVEPRVNEKSVYSYVVPRLPVLLGRLLRASV